MNDLKKVKLHVARAKVKVLAKDVLIKTYEIECG